MLLKKGCDFLPEVRNLSQLSFEDYFRIKQLLKEKDQLPTVEVTQHDSDIVTYQDAYDIINRTIDSLSDYVTQRTDFDYDVVALLMSVLMSKKVLTEKEVNAILKNAERILEKKDDTDEAE